MKSVARAGVKTLFVSALLASSSLVAAQATTPAETGSSDAVEGLGDIVVTALKRNDTLQNIPLAITAIDTKKLDQLQVADFYDYARYLPSLSYQSIAPGFSNVYFRGIASGENANHSAQLPSVGTYLDEAPITTIQGALDIHVYDIARVEALAGPQGTLYGASSEAGTVRIITNKPELGKFYGAANAEVNTVRHGDQGYVGEGFVNIPVADMMALRVVGWYDHAGGYIDNIYGSRTFPTGNLTVNNAPFVKKNYNDVDTYGGRASLLIELDDNWTVMPQIMGQKQKTNGSFAEELGLKKYQTIQYNPEKIQDNWYQAALTITGKIGSFDLTYAGAYLNRKDHTQSDYSDYAYYYDALFGYGAYYVDNQGNPIPNQRVDGYDRYKKMSHELRLSWQGDHAHWVIGGFYQRQTHNIEQHYIIDGLADALWVDPSAPDNIWLTKQRRIDRDYAAFGELTVNPTDKWEVTIGARVFKFDNSLVGFYGYGSGFSGSTGVAACFGPTIVPGSPCTNLDKRVKDTGFTHKINVTYKITPNKLIYFTNSRGFRPGGINRRGTLPPYKPDFVLNYEAGWKTSWFDNRLRWNGALYWIDWKDIQFSYLGANGLTEIRNAGNGRSRGVETEITAAPIRGLTLTLSGAYTDAKLKTPYCRIANPQFDCSIPGGNFTQAPAGTRLPITPKFKGNVQARYEFDALGGTAHVQAAGVYQSKISFDLRTVERGILGDQKGYGTVDFAAGWDKGPYSVELYVRNAFDVEGGTFRTTQCAVQTCGGTVYSFPIQPMTIGLRLGTKF
ncbi:MAG: TonB-dependent receptor [Sphingomonas sanxanigenens]|uniref:TonB-dependent receptor n=1 Tax=Sphingomonas sanxanigenens TaxID=397260 RepID=A0A2W5C5K0_9SPHN|nr:MAG: TonB-dependent receptor [Sphingomonas sanxanigenens]